MRLRRRRGALWRRACADDDVAFCVPVRWRRCSAPLNQRPVAVALTVLFIHAPLCSLRCARCAACTRSTPSVRVALPHAHAPRSLLSPRHARSRVDSLKFTSALSMCLSFMFISITLCLVANASAGDVLKTLPVMMTAYVCHYNVHPIFSEMAAPSERRMRGVVTAALMLCSSVYWLVGLSAYLLFTERTQDDVLMNFGRDLDMARGEAWVEHAVKTGYALSLSCTFPLIQFALRQSVFDLAGWGDAREQPRRFYAVTVRARVPVSPTRVRVHRGSVFSADASTLCLVRLQFVLLGMEYLLAMLVPNISVAFSVLGSTVAVLIGTRRRLKACTITLAHRLCASCPLLLTSPLRCQCIRLHPAGAGGHLRHAQEQALGLGAACCGHRHRRVVLLSDRLRPGGAGVVSRGRRTHATRAYAAGLGLTGHTRVPLTFR